jgi:hypothetical protein
MKKALAAMMVLFVGVAFAGDLSKKFPLTINVTGMENVESQYESGGASGGHVGNFGSASSKYGHTVTKHIYANGSDGLTYDLTPMSGYQDEILLPGSYLARAEKYGLRVCKPNDKGDGCSRQTTFRVVAAKPAQQ